MTPALEKARDKLLQIFRYIQALDQLRNPVQRNINDQPWLLWFRDLPEHTAVSRGVFSAPEDDEDSDSSNIADYFILKVRRPVLKRAPEPPEELASWLLDGWQNIDGEVKILDSKEEEIGNGQTRVVNFNDDPMHTGLLEKWRSERDKWLEAEKPARRAMTIFERLYSLYSQLEREAEKVELLLGEGVLHWSRHDGQSLNHPILLERIQLDFNPDLPEFTLKETDQPPELYTPMFRSISEVNASAISRCRQDLEDGGWHPLGGSETTDFLKRVVVQLSPHGEFIEQVSSSEIKKDAPTIKRDPVVFLRKRNLGFSAAIEAILEDLPGRDSLPPCLTNITGIESETEQSSVPETSYLTPNGEDEDILLSKEANAEQLQLAKRLEKYGAVLVQGPPGTGKTHTIANLIGHLLAQGKTVLVTSHTAKALKVLREHVVEEIRPLCVSVLQDSKQQMESAVDAIVEHLSNYNVETLEREASKLKNERIQILKRLQQLRENLLSARLNEYNCNPVVIAGEEYPPSQAARRVAAGAGKDDWIPGPVTLGIPLPLSNNEIVELYRSNALISRDDEKELMVKLPRTGELLSPFEYEELIAKHKELSSKDLSLGEDFWKKNRDLKQAETLKEIMDKLSQAIVMVDGSQWQLAAIEAGHEGDKLKASWDSLLSEIENVYQMAVESKETFFMFDVSIPYDLINRIENDVDEILRHLDHGKQLGWTTLLMKKPWKEIIAKTKINNQPPSKKEHFLVMQKYLQLRAARASLIERWRRQIEMLEGPKASDLGPEPENICRQYTFNIRLCLDWYQDHWEPLKQELDALGFKWDVFFASAPPNLTMHGNLKRLRDAVKTPLPSVIAAEVDRFELKVTENRLRTLSLKVQDASFSENNSAPLVLQALGRAIKNKDVQAYLKAFKRLDELQSMQDAGRRRNMCLATLEKDAPAWAADVRARIDVHGLGEPSGDVKDAWIWRQLNDELDKRAKVSFEELQNEIDQLSSDLLRITSSLVEKKAWAAQIRRTGLTQQQALQGWRQIIGKIGKGTGIRAPRLQTEARKIMAICQTAVPVWIMPMSLVAENYNPGKNQFDVVIIDEASQADVMAIVALYMGKQVVIVGDHEQVSPVDIGRKQEEVQKLIDEHLDGIPNGELYDGQFSVYDLAQTSYKPVMLQEHFRCVPPIIQFSNHLSYDGRIKPLRDASEVKRKPFTVAYKVEGGISDDKVNKKEALTIASLLTACTEMPEYDGATFGVITLLGDDQAMYIDCLLQRYLPASEYKQRQIQCGNSAHFQGDERTVIFLSMVDSPSGAGPLGLRVDGPMKIFKKRYNVAASRARDQMWLVYSLTPDIDLKPGDLRLRLINHAKDPDALMNLLDAQLTKTESEFEKLVLQKLIRAGYRVKTQWLVGAYRIDMVVQGANDQRLAVECDGDRWHTYENLKDDICRQAILERLGWRFVRIRGSLFFRDPDKAMEPVLRKLAQMEILPIGPDIEENTQDEAANSLKNKVISRATELMEQWEGQDDEAILFKRDGYLQERHKDSKLPRKIIEAIEPIQKAIGMEERVATPREGISRYGDNIQTSIEDMIARPKVINIQERLFPLPNQEKEKKISLQDSIKPTDNPGIQFDLLEYLHQNGLEVIDKRLKGGALWVLGEKEQLSPLMNFLKSKKIYFTFSQRGGKATNHRPAWFHYE